MVAAYKVPLFEELVARLLINVQSVILANLVLGENVVPEFLQRDVHAGAAGRGPDAAVERYAANAAGRSRPSPGSMPSWKSAKPPPATAPPPWSWIAPAPRPTAARNSGIRPANSVVCLVRPIGLMPWPLTGIAAFDHFAARLDYRSPWLPAAGPADQFRTGAHGGHQRRLDHRTHRHQGTPHPEGRGARHLAHGGGSGARPAAEDRHQAGRNRPADLRHHHAGHAVPVDRQHHLRHGRRSRISARSTCRRPARAFSIRSPSPRNSSPTAPRARWWWWAPTRCRRSSTIPIAPPACCSATPPAPCCWSRAWTAPASWMR